MQQDTDPSTQGGPGDECPGQGITEFISRMPEEDQVQKQVHDEEEIEGDDQDRVGSSRHGRQEREQQRDMKENEEATPPAIGERGEPGEDPPFMTPHCIQFMDEKQG